MSKARVDDLASISYGDGASPTGHLVQPLVNPQGSAASSASSPLSVSIAAAESDSRTSAKIRPTRVANAVNPSDYEPEVPRSILESLMVDPDASAVRGGPSATESAAESAAVNLQSVVDLLESVNPSNVLGTAAVQPVPVLEQMEAPECEPAPESNPMEPLLLAISGARNRTDAVVTMVEWLAKAMPGTAIRCGIGTTKLNRLFDSRLGWLGSESSLHRELSPRWSEFVGDDACSSMTSSQIYIRLARPGQRKFAVLCLSGLSLPPAVFDRLKQVEVMMGSLLFGRPSIAVPNWAATRGRPRITLVIAIIMVLLLLVCPVPYRASCMVLVEPINTRVVSAPFAATIETVLVEPGSEVKAGQSLVTLDGRPLRLEQQSLESEIQQSSKQRDVAMAAGKIAEAQLAQLKNQQLARQRELIERRLGQLTITSPIDGVVVAGDLRRSVGAALETGQVMLEIASLDSVKIEVEIPEREIGLVSDDSPVQFRVESARMGTVDAYLKQIYPAAQLRDDTSVFVAPIEIENPSHRYRPGMRGKATVYGPIRPWAWTYVRGLIEQAAWLLGL